MKRVYNKIVPILIMIVVLSSCKKNDDPGPSDIDKQIDLLAKTWNVKTTASAVTLDGQDENSEWIGFTLTFTESKTYSASNISGQRLNTVWSTNGTWDFKSSTELNTIVRDDGIEMNVNVDAENLTLTFTYSEPGGRIKAVEGNWVFRMQ